MLEKMRLTDGMRTGVVFGINQVNYENYERIISPLSLATVAGMDTYSYMPASINVFEVYDKVSPLLVALLPRKGEHFFFPVCAANNSRNSKSPPISPLPFPGSFPLGFDKTSPRYSSFFRTLKPWHAQAPGEQRHHRAWIALEVGKLGSRRWLGMVGAASFPADCVREAGIDANR